MQVLFALAVLNLLVFLHPYISYPLSLRLLPRRPVARRPDALPPTASGVFSAYNEARSLPAKIANLRAIRALHPDIEFLAYSDMSSDATLAMLTGEPDLIRVIPSTERAGKATGMRKMVAAAHGEICIFTDANVILDPACVGPLLSYFSDPDVGGVAGTLRYINEHDSTTAMVGGLYWRLEECLKRLESRCGSIIGADGSIFATRRSLYPNVPPHLLDDMTVSMTVTFQGKRLIHAEDVIAYEKSATDPVDEFRRKRRISCRAFNTHRHIWPEVWRTYPAIDIYKYLSHKLLRWFGFVPLTLSAVFAAAALEYEHHHLHLAILTTAAVGGYLAGAAGVRPFAAGTEILRSVLATFCGLVDSMRGKTYQTWAPVKSRD